MLRVYLQWIDDFDTSTFSTDTDTNVTLDEVKEAVGEELEGPGKLLITEHYIKKSGKSTF